jgi:DNA-binding GntR family transcriptional regulator
MVGSLNVENGGVFVVYPDKPIFSTILEQVYNRIKDDILSGVYGPGYHLQEKELAEKLGVSRSSVREALKQLSVEGLTDHLPHKGVIVKSLNEVEINEIFEIRAVLERAALERAIERITEAEINEINMICAD